MDRPDTLHKIKLRVVSNGVCAYLNADPFFTVHPNNVCALGTIRFTGACQVRQVCLVRMCQIRTKRPWVWARAAESTNSQRLQLRIRPENIHSDYDSISASTPV